LILQEAVHSFRGEVMNARKQKLCAAIGVSIALSIGLSSSSPRGTASPSASKPNIVYIVADDLGWKDVGYHGSDIRTPALDALAAKGARLEQFYVQPMCTPTRASFLTGRYPLRYGLQTLVIPSASTYGLPTDEWLLPQALKEAGYTTALVGKWHLGHADKKFWPMQRGFDVHYGPLIGELDYFTHEQHGVTDWFRDNKELKEEGYTTTLLGNEAVKEIEAQDPAKPLFLYLAFNAPHTPYQAPKEYLDKYASIEDKDRRAYAAMITAVDDQVGRVVAALEKKKMRENTLIVFHSDNGGTRNAMFAGELDMSKTKIPCDNGPYREGKGSLYEGGTRVCALANWPGRIQPGVVDQMIHVVDMYPTIAALSGASTVKCKPLDGLDVWKTMSENQKSPRTEIVYNIEPFRGAVREGDWKLIWRTPLPSSFELYDVAHDPAEKNDVAAANPAKVAELQKRIEELAKQSAKSLFLLEQFQGTQKGLHRPPALPNEDAYFETEDP
jgi:arylsulfatase A-like enzyme